MAKQYTQLTLDDRCAIAHLHQAGQSRQPNRGSSGSLAINHLSRNDPQSGAKIGYKPAYANQQTPARRWTGSKLE